jgi:integrase
MADIPGAYGPTRDQHAPDADASDSLQARAVVVSAGTPEDEDSNPPPPGTSRRTWRQELPRWLATLDSGRTRREYEKAVGYFFGAQGVPQELGALTLDLLLAYRGSLALRADRRAQRAPTASAGTQGSPPLPPQEAPEALAGEDGAWDAADASGTERDAVLMSPLAPATVNVRLTALRQFLAHCSLWHRVPQLPPERMRAALRRLRIERRRPYQVLEEHEWVGFLRAAAGGPQTDSAAPVEARAAALRDETAAPTALAYGGPPMRRTGPWGTTRAARRRQQAASRPLSTQEVPTPLTPPEAGASHTSIPRRSRAGLTGRRTAQRDHALLALALASGLRAIELCALDVDNLTREWHQDQAEWWLVLRDAQTKGQRGGRTLPLAQPLVRTLLDYIASTGRSWDRAADRGTPLFLSLRTRAAHEGSEEVVAASQMRRLTPEQVRRIADRVETQWLAAAGAAVGDRQESDTATRAISPHALRHSTAIALLEGNQRAGRPPASVEHVRGWLGHFDIRTTQGYLAHLDARSHRRPFALTPDSDAAPAVEGEGPTREELGDGN